MIASTEKQAEVAATVTRALEPVCEGDRGLLCGHIFVHYLTELVKRSNEEKGYFPLCLFEERAHRLKAILKFDQFDHDQMTSEDTVRSIFHQNRRRTDVPAVQVKLRRLDLSQLRRVKPVEDPVDIRSRLYFALVDYRKDKWFVVDHVSLTGRVKTDSLLVSTVGCVQRSITTGGSFFDT